jgi:hypothetical protein
MGPGHSREVSGRRDSSGGSVIDESDDSPTYADKYNARALEPMLKWIQSKVVSNRQHFFQYDEVIEQLNLYSPRHGCAVVFARLVLLPAIKLHGQLSDVPESLVVVLSTLHLVRDIDTRLVDVKREGPHVVFVVADGAGVISYRLRNYLNLDQIGLEAL